MHTTIKNHRRSFIRFALLGLVSAFALPSVGNATAPGSNDVDPTAAAECPPPSSTISLEVDVATGYVYYLDPNGTLTTLVDNELDVYVGTLSTVLVDLEYSTGEWVVEISPSGGTTQVKSTRGGTLRYWMNTSPDEYLFSSTARTAMAMMNMTPVVPDIIIRPKPTCPPPT
jgi:hypothetical protein